MGERELEVKVHPTAVITGDVEFLGRAEVGAHVYLEGPLLIEDGVKIYPGCVIGCRAESYGEGTSDAPIHIGAGTVLREKVVIQRSLSGGRPTSIGENCYIMDGCHVAHDCRVDDEVTMAPKVVLGGHSTIMFRANLGIGSMTHQFVTVGAYAMVGMGSVVIHDIRPGAKVCGSPAEIYGKNDFGLRKYGDPELGLYLAEFERVRSRMGARMRRQ